MYELLWMKIILINSLFLSFFLDKSHFRLDTFLSPDT